VAPSDDGVKSNSEGERMSWETPTFVEIRMDAEINSYQDEFDGI
jgi:coenzyme PQQ precursor peptide PqqA